MMMKGKATLVVLEESENKLKALVQWQERGKCYAVLTRMKDDPKRWSKRCFAVDIKWLRETGDFQVGVNACDAEAWTSDLDLAKRAFAELAE